MNLLQRIILINSGNISYREIHLDGNIHFIGTQGTGKSTLLRAILFLYNADSRKLDLSKEQKSFADYYFPHADSYIFFEVRKEQRTFCVWLYRKQNRLCFRFIDGSFSKEMVINKNHARIETDVIAEAGNLEYKVERPIYNFSEYRDILYSANKSMHKYSLLKNKTYQNIPRTISNIFLNSSLDGGFIKKTIINSLSDEIFEINLDVNRHHLEKARGDYEDVNEYIKHEKKAQIIVSLFNNILKQEQHKKEGEASQEILELKGTQKLQEFTNIKIDLTKKNEKLISEISSLEGSLLEFLENEKPGWESSIGKVIGRDLLLRDDLNPKIEEGNNIYGLKLQLQDVETIKISKKELESELYKNQLLQNTNNKEIAKHQQQIQNKRDKLTQKFSKKIVEVSEKIKLKTYEFHHTETAIEKNIISRNQINEKAGIKKNKEILKLENEKHKIETQFNESIKILKQINEFEDKAIQELKKQLKAKEKEFTQQLVSITANVQSQISTLELELERQLKDIETLRNSTLKKKGVDTLKLHSIESIITELNRKLEEINENYKTIIEYQKDCKEYIYKLNDFRRNRKKLEEEIQHKESLFKKRLKSENEIHEKHNTDYKKIGITLEDNTRQVESMQRFAKEILYEELKSYLEHHDKFEAEACDTLIERLKNLAIEHQKKDKQLIERITEFSGFFNQNNCLGFEITVNSDEQYRAFAIILKNL